MSNVPIDEQVPSFHEIEEHVRDIFECAFESMPPFFVSTMLEQYRALVRNHLEASECDPFNEQQLKAFILGGTLAIHFQSQYTPVPQEVITLPMTALNMMYFKNDDDVAGLQNLALLFTQSQTKKSRSKFRRIFRHLF